MSKGGDPRAGIKEFEVSTAAEKIFCARIKKKLRSLT